MLEEVQRAVDVANDHLARVEQVKRFAVLPVEWTAESGELTPTLKMRRRVILERYTKEIEGLYSSTSRSPWRGRWHGQPRSGRQHPLS